ncbi:MAG TPA: glycosyltransferase family 39 protein [Candidatus Paceibacterota bacterium]
MSKTQRSVLLTGILIIAIFLRFYHFTTTPPGLYPDEAMDGNNAVEVAETNQFQVFYPEDNGREGLYVNIIAVILKVWPVYEPWIIRLPAAVAGVLTVWGLYLLVAELFGNGPGLLAAFLLATSFWGVIFSRIGFRAILAPLALVFTLWLIIKAFRAGNKRAGFLLAALAGIVYGLGFYTYIAYRVTPILFLLFIPFFRKLPGFWKRTALFIIVTFIVAAPLGWYFATTPGSFFGRTAEISVTSASSPAHDFAVNIVKEALMFNYHGDYNWRQNVSGAPELFWPVGMLFLLGIVLSGYYVIRRWRKKYITAENEKLFPQFGILLTFTWLIFGILPAAASDEGIPHALRSILALAPALIFATLGGVWLYRIIKKHWSMPLAKSLMVAFIIVVAGWGYYDYFVVWAQNPNVPGAFSANYVTIGQEINALPASTPKYVVVNAGGVLARGVPVPAETTMFITHSFTTADAAAANIHYVVPGSPTDGTSTIPTGTPSAEIFYID